MITVCILSKNCSPTLRATLASVRGFQEVILLDTGSTDETLSIASQFPNVRIHHSPFIGFGPLRDRASSLASYDWVLALDGDEALSPALSEEIFSLSLADESKIFAMKRENFYNGKKITGCGWGNDWVKRLYSRKRTQFGAAQVHESLKEKGCSITPLKHLIFHTPMRKTEDFLTKMQNYSTLFAQQHLGKRKSSFSHAFAHGLFSFFKSYLLQRGFLDGKEGFLISLYNANTTFYKYIKLMEGGASKSESPPDSPSAPKPEE